MSVCAQETPPSLLMYFLGADFSGPTVIGAPFCGEELNNRTVAAAKYVVYAVNKTAYRQQLFTLINGLGLVGRKVGETCVENVR